MSYENVASITSLHFRKIGMLSSVALDSSNISMIVISVVLSCVSIDRTYLSLSVILTIKTTSVPLSNEQLISND